MVLREVKQDTGRVPHESNERTIGLFFGISDSGGFICTVLYYLGRVCPPRLRVFYSDVHHEIVSPVFVVVVLEIAAAVGKLQLSKTIIGSSPVNLPSQCFIELHRLGEVHGGDEHLHVDGTRWTQSNLLSDAHLVWVNLTITPCRGPKLLIPKTAAVLVTSASREDLLRPFLEGTYRGALVWVSPQNHLIRLELLIKAELGQPFVDRKTRILHDEYNYEADRVNID